MIAANYRRHADALIRQLELDLSNAAEATPQQRAAWWSWLMQAGIVQALPKASRPAWLVDALRLARAIARAVRDAIGNLF
jgi:hypothetical protein